MASKADLLKEQEKLVQSIKELDNQLAAFIASDLPLDLKLRDSWRKRASAIAEEMTERQGLINQIKEDLAPRIQESAPEVVVEKVVSSIKPPKVSSLGKKIRVDWSTVDILKDYETVCFDVNILAARYNLNPATVRARLSKVTKGA